MEGAFEKMKVASTWGGEQPHSWNIHMTTRPKRSHLSPMAALSWARAGKSMAQWSSLGLAVHFDLIWLVVYQPLWKIWKSVVMIIPNIWENKTCSKPPTSDICVFWWPESKDLQDKNPGYGHQHIINMVIPSRNQKSQHHVSFFKMKIGDHHHLPYQNFPFVHLGGHFFHFQTHPKKWVAFWPNGSGGTINDLTFGPSQRRDEVLRLRSKFWRSKSIDI